MEEGNKKVQVKKLHSEVWTLTSSSGQNPFWGMSQARLGLVLSHSRFLELRNQESRLSPREKTLRALAVPPHTPEMVTRALYDQWKVQGESKVPDVLVLPGLALLLQEVVHHDAAHAEQEENMELSLLQPTYGRQAPQECFC